MTTDKTGALYVAPEVTLHVPPPAPGDLRAAHKRLRELIRKPTPTPEDFCNKFEDIAKLAKSHDAAFRQTSTLLSPSLLRTALEVVRTTTVAQGNADAITIAGMIMGKTQSAFDSDRGQAAKPAALRLFRDATRAVFTLSETCRNTFLPLTLENGVQAQGHAALQTSIAQVAASDTPVDAADALFRQHLLQVCGDAKMLDRAMESSAVGEYHTCAVIDLTLLGIAQRLGMDIPLNKFARDAAVRTAVVELAGERLAEQPSEDLVMLLGIANGLAHDASLQNLRALCTFSTLPLLAGEK